MRPRIACLVGLGAAFLISGAATVPTATASSPTAGSSASAPAAAVSLSHNPRGSAAAAGIAKSKGKCHTSFGRFADDGIISWSAPASGIDAAGAADFTCTKEPNSRRSFSTITLMGYYGDIGTSRFDVTVYGNLSGEPDNHGSPVCPTQTATGTPTGDEAEITVITLDTPCKGRLGSNWLEIQAVTDSVWYWATQSSVGGRHPADWRDTLGTFGTPCSPGYQDDVYMQECVFGGDAGEEDFMFTLN